MNPEDRNSTRPGDFEPLAAELARRHNRDLLLQLIRLRQPLSRADLARDSGIRPSTVSVVVDELKAEGWVVEGGSVARPRGRRPTMLSLNDRIGVLVADVHPRRAVVALLDLPGRLLARRIIPLASQPLRAIQAMTECMSAMRAEHAAMTIKGIGVSLPGRIDPATQHLVFAPNLNWVNLDIRAAFEERMKLPVELENDANGCLLSELWFGRMQGVRDAVLVAIDEGVGTALMTNGRLVRGHSGMAGEFGHIQLDPAGPLCGCGQQGCWETLASSSAALRYYAELAPEAATPDVTGLMHLAEEGDPQALAALTRQAEYIGKGLRLLTASLAPETILLTGEITSLWSIFGKVIEANLATNLLGGIAPRLAPAADAESARLRGAAVVLLQRVIGQML
ncbi:Sugar kinase of the NBD/HSP70 family, may contain an N-terminal HTH domain [Granulicella rosea]|uniref:Sugar kinase of the NBD/HSP70 family, may contain an N-terminal HTH domain n=1 Tax=Granulicella rosea TaxID=474952 RepID=A0A239D9L9_9BACT|nr:ROK family transcriptional regulator [Granulicella rosea]SNS28738.1 Sugar kinase of the NBD/HSP70 family, may contain an N-terminal HTH domain [Granulicella rosea]